MMQSRTNLNIATAFQMGVAFRLGYEYALHREIASLIKAKIVQARLITNDAEFKENQHPRDKDGKFKSGKNLGHTIEDAYGPEITLLKPSVSNAVNALLKYGRGHIKGAIHRDDIGDIDLMWGDSKRGLKHIIESRQKHGQSATKVLNILPELLEKGALTTFGDDRRNAVNFYLVCWKNGIGYRAVITKLLSKDENNKLHYVLTDMLITDEDNKGALVKKQG